MSSVYKRNFIDEQAEFFFKNKVAYSDSCKQQAFSLFSLENKERNGSHLWSFFLVFAIPVVKRVASNNLALLLATCVLLFTTTGHRGEANN